MPDMEVEVEGGSKKMKLDIDMDKLISETDEEPRQVEIVITDLEKRRQQPPPATTNCGDEINEDYSNLNDHKLSESIMRQMTNLRNFGPKLRDKGAKIQACIKALEAERERRKVLAEKNGVNGNGWMDSSKSVRSDTAGFSNGSKQEDNSSLAFSQSTFGPCGVKRTEENAGCRIINQFDGKSSSDYPEHQKTRSVEEFYPRERQKNQSSSRQQHSHTPRKLSLNGCRVAFSNGERNDRSSVFSPHNNVDDQPRFFDEKNNTSQARRYRLRPRKEQSKGQTIVLDDEEVPMLTTEEEAKLSGVREDATIYYPSRDDPDSIEISFEDIGNLNPETFLSSTIMNFYIRYLQQEAPPVDREVFDCHYFNTYFYSKLTDPKSGKVVSFDESGKNNFSRFRRWWKGVNIFEKAYVLIPIHEQKHWSLVIICIPDKDDESGPIMLHLDSLGFHPSELVFENIKCFLKEEWKYLKQQGSTPNLPIRDHVWNDLPNRIEQKVIPVPQQKNDFDCGPFVLYFMERFIEEAPERLKKSDISMFGRKWFKPEEASGLRRKIKRILAEQFLAAMSD